MCLWILEREGERQRETSISCLPNTRQPGIQPATQARAVTTTLQPTEPPSQGKSTRISEGPSTLGQAFDKRVLFTIPATRHARSRFPYKNSTNNSFTSRRRGLLKGVPTQTLRLSCHRLLSLYSGRPHQDSASRGHQQGPGNCDPGQAGRGIHG